MVMIEVAGVGRIEGGHVAAVRTGGRRAVRGAIESNPRGTGRIPADQGESVAAAAGDAARKNQWRECSELDCAMSNSSTLVGSRPMPSRNMSV